MDALPVWTHGDCARAPLPIYAGGRRGAGAASSPCPYQSRESKWTGGRVLACMYCTMQQRTRCDAKIKGESSPSAVLCQTVRGRGPLAGRIEVGRQQTGAQRSDSEPTARAGAQAPSWQAPAGGAVAILTACGGGGVAAGRAGPRSRLAGGRGGKGKGALGGGGRTDVRTSRANKFGEKKKYTTAEDPPPRLAAHLTGAWEYPVRPIRRPDLWLRSRRGTPPPDSALFPVVLAEAGCCGKAGGRGGVASRGRASSSKPARTSSTETIGQHHP